MKIKKRLVISNTLTVLIPIIITITAAFIFIIISTKILNKDVSFENFKKLASIKTEVFSMASGISKDDNEPIDENEFQKYLQQRLCNLNGKYIITENNSVIFASKDINKFDAQICFQQVKKQSGQNMVEINGRQYIVGLTDIKFKNGIIGNVLLLAPIGDKVDIFKMLIIAINERIW